MCWNSDQSHYILCYHGHHLHRLQIRNLHRLQMQDFCSFGFTLDWSILWRFKCCIRLKYKCPKGKDKTMYDLENVCPWDKNTYRTMYRMYLGQAHGKMYYFSVIYLHWKNYKKIPLDMSHLESCLRHALKSFHICNSGWPTTERMCLH